MTEGVLELKKAETLQELIDAVKKSDESGKILMSQHETSQSAVTLGDEDTEAGTRLRVKIVFGDLYYAEEFQDDLLYEETIEMIMKLQETVPVEIVSEAEIDKLTDH